MNELEKAIWQYLWDRKVNQGQCASVQEVANHFTFGFWRVAVNYMKSLHDQGYLWLFPGEEKKYLIYDNPLQSQDKTVSIPVWGYIRRYGLCYDTTNQVHHFYWKDGLPSVNLTKDMATTLPGSFAALVFSFARSVEKEDEFHNRDLLVFTEPRDNFDGKWCVVNVDDRSWYLVKPQVIQRHRRTVVKVNEKEYDVERVGLVGQLCKLVRRYK